MVFSAWVNLIYTLFISLFISLCAVTSERIPIMGAVFTHTKQYLTLVTFLLYPEALVFLKIFFVIREILYGVRSTMRTILCLTSRTTVPSHHAQIFYHA